MAKSSIRKLISGLLVVISLCGLSATPVQASEFEIKNLHLGISQKDLPVEKRCKVLAGKTICQVKSPKETVGGESALYYFVTFHSSGRVELIDITFAATSYEAVKQAVETKYSSMSCSKEVVRNGLGVTFPSEICNLSGKTEVIMMALRSSEIQTSSLTLLSLKAYQELIGAAKKKKIDI